MIRRAAYLGFAALALALGACTDVRTSQPASDAERAAARSLLRQLSALSVAPESASDILAATDASSILALIAPEGAPVPMSPPADYGVEAVSLRPDCLIATATSVTSSHCTIGSHAVEGTWSAEDHRIHAELVDVYVIGPELHGAIAVEANLSSTAELSGALDADFMWSTAEGDFYSYVIDASVRIDNLVLEGADCASGGTITITSTMGKRPRTTVSLWFGPGCSDVQIAR